MFNTQLNYNALGPCSLVKKLMRIESMHVKLLIKIEGMILTESMEREIKVEGVVVRVQPVWKWMLE